MSCFHVLLLFGHLDASEIKQSQAGQGMDISNEEKNILENIVHLTLSYYFFHRNRVYFWSGICAECVCVQTV